MYLSRLAIFGSLLLVLGYAAAIIGGYKTFHLWNQVEYLHSMGGLELADALSHAHWLRYQLVTPFYILSDFFDFDVSLFFSFFCLIVLVVVASVLSYLLISELDVKFDFCVVWFFVFFAFFVFSFFMNGRLFYGLFSVCLLLLFFKFFLDGKSWIFSSIVLFFALLFSSVSSGVFLSVAVVVFLSVFISFFVCFCKKKLKGRRFAYAFYCLVGLLFLPIALVMAGKNLSYYGGSFVGMVAHGVAEEINVVEGDVEVVRGGVEEVINEVRLLALKAIWFFSGIVWVIYAVAVTWKDLKKHRYFSFYVSLAMAAFFCLSVFAYSIVAISLVLVVYMLVSLGLKATVGREFSYE